MYDKRRDYNFEILGLVSPYSNVPNMACRGVFISQFIRFANICSFKADFIINCLLLCNRFLKIGLTIKTITSYLTLVLLKKHTWIGTKYNSDTIHADIISILTSPEQPAANQHTNVLHSVCL